MAVPSVLTDLTIDESTNFPPDTETVTATTRPSDYLRAHASILRRPWAKGADVASATAASLGSNTDGDYFHITGTTGLAASNFGTVDAGIERTIVFDGALLLTHNGTSFILPGAANITTAAGDVAVFRSEGSGNWKCVSYQYASLASTVVDTERSWTTQQVPFDGTLTDGATINWDADSNGQVVSVTLAGNRTLAAPTNVNENACYVLRVHQDATGSRTMAWDDAYKFPGGIDPVLTTTASAVDIFTFVGGAGNVMYCVGQARGLA